MRERSTDEVPTDEVPTDEPSTDEPVELRDLAVCFEGAIPAVVATADASGVPNITYLSRVRMVDGSHIALSNQFFSKTARNLAENPRASVLLANPVTYEQYRITARYERTLRKGPIFDQLRADVEVVAALQGMQDVFRLRAADIYRVLDVERMIDLPELTEQDRARARRGPVPDRGASLAELSGRLGRAADLDTLVGATVDGVAQLLGYEHVSLLLLDESGTKLFTIASHGYPDQGVGSEVAMGEGIVGLAAANAEPVCINNVRQLQLYSETLRLAYTEGVGPGREIPLPDFPEAQSRLAVPAMALGELVGALVVESDRVVAYDDADELLLTVVATLVANAIEAERAGQAEPVDDAPEVAPVAPAAATATRVRFFASDGSVFLDDEYLIKGVAGRILWSLLGHHEREGRTDFTNKEVRLDPTLELPEFRDNLESRLILLKRRLDEQSRTIHIEKTGRGRFRLVVDGPFTLDGE
jgi:predicted pyridoxine 5'-phosphate oxidase superfamily flavin-nucleotide-binding protein